MWKSAWAGLLAWGGVGATAQVLFDPALGPTAGDQGWTVFAPPPVVATINPEGFFLDTRPAGTPGQAGLLRETPTPLNAAEGFVLSWILRVTDEDHRSGDRAGVSVIVLGDDRRGIELGFWADRVWAQSDLPLFTHAEETVWDTSRAAVRYALTVVGSTYSLSADGAPVLSGPLRNYTAFEGFPDVYEIPNFLFLGDDTTSASGAMTLGRIELSPIPAPVLTLHPVADGTLELAWAETVPPWSPEETGGSLQGSDWQPVNGIPSTAGGVNRLQFAPSADARYFRLRR